MAQGKAMAHTLVAPMSKKFTLRMYTHIHFGFACLFNQQQKGGMQDVGLEDGGLETPLRP